MSSSCEFLLEIVTKQKKTIFAKSFEPISGRKSHPKFQKHHSLSYAYIIYMSEIEQIASKSLAELRVIAKTLGIKRVESYKKNELTNLIAGGAAPEASTKVSTKDVRAEPTVTADAAPATDAQEGPKKRGRKPKS